MEDDEALREARVGAALKAARGRESQRAVAARAKLSPTQWRHMEQGVRDNGVPVRASDKTLEAAALAVGLDPTEVFALAGRAYDGPVTAGRVVQVGLEKRVEIIEADLAEIRAAVQELLARAVDGEEP